MNEIDFYLNKLYCDLESDGLKLDSKDTLFLTKILLRIISQLDYLIEIINKELIFNDK